MENHIAFIEKCLKKYEYPNVHSVVIAEIFSGSNRTFLLSWLYRNMHDESEMIFSPDVLSEFLNAYGFCKSSQTKKFIESDLEFPIQLEILHRMFKMLDTLKKERKCNENSSSLALEELKLFKERDLNIFPHFGPIRVCDNIDLKNVKTMNCSKEEQHDEKSSINFQIEKLLKIENNVKIAKVIVENILNKNESRDSTQGLDEKSMNILKEFNKNVKEAKEYIRNVEALPKFSELLGKTLSDLTLKSDDENAAMVKEVIKLIHEINDM